jgi:hypothetical protein
VYEALKGVEGIPKVYGFGTEGKYNILIIELLGKNLETLLSEGKKTMETLTILALAEQMVIVEDIVDNAYRGCT